MSSSFIKDVLANFVGFDLPPQINSRFHTLELLSQNELGETFLLSEKDSGQRFVLKSFRSLTPVASESEILQGLSHKGLPKFEPQITWDKAFYTLREYIDGVSLHEYMDELQLLDEEEALHIFMQVCDVVGYIHSQPIPIIHRDVKPSNIIINPESGNITLIDFGIARRYNLGSSKDTTVFATIEFAPPEQFGFAQTDTRTDIYAIGVLLRYMLTGYTGHNTPIANKPLERVVQKCTALDPKDRFQTTGAIKKAVSKHKKSTSRFAMGIAGVVLCLLLVAAGYMLAVLRQPAPSISYPYTPPLPIGANTDVYVFHEPLVEVAVRRQFDLYESEPITYGHLEAITGIRLYGMNPLIPGYTGYQYGPYWGNVNTLEDFRQMPNLQQLTLGYQPLYDLSPLSGNLELHRVLLFTTNVSDISPLQELPGLSMLYAHSRHITDWSPLENMQALYHLMLQDSRFSSISDLGDISLVRWLKIRRSYSLVSLEGVQNMPLLTVLNIADTAVQDFSLLNDVEKLPYFRQLVISADMEQYLHTLTRDDVEVGFYP